MTRGRSMRLEGVVAAIAAAGVLAAGCGGDGETEGPATTAAPAETHTMPAETMPETGMDHGTASGETAAAAISSPAADLRITLDRLLGEHAALAMLATQKGVSGDEDFEQIAAALDENSVELSEAIGSVYGDEAAKEFLDGELKWRDHIGFFVDYTVALAKGDEAAQEEAVGDLMG